MEPDEPFVTDVKDWPPKQEAECKPCPSCGGATCNHAISYIDKTHNKVITYQAGHALDCPFCLRNKLTAMQEENARLKERCRELMDINLTRTNERNDLQSRLTEAEAERDKAKDTRSIWLEEGHQQWTMWEKAAEKYEKKWIEAGAEARTLREAIQRFQAATTASESQAAYYAMMKAASGKVGEQ